MGSNNNHRDVDALIKRYEDALSVGRQDYYDVDELEELSEYYLINGNRQASGAVIELGLKLHPNNSILLLKRATLYVEIGEYQHALHILDRLPEKEDLDVRLLRAEVFLRLNRKQEGLRILKAIMDEDSTDRVLRCLDVTAILSDQTWYDMAIEYLLLVLQDYPDNLELLEELAWCYEQDKAYEKSTPLYERMLDVDPYKVDAWFNLGQSWFNLDEYNKAVDAYEFAIAINPEDMLAMMQLAHALFQGGRYLEAAKAYKEYMDVDGESDAVFVFLAESLEKAGKMDEAQVHYASAFRLNASNIDACTGMAICLMEQKLYQESLSWFDKALSIEEEDPEIWVYVAELMLQMDMREEASMCYLRSLTLKKDQPDVLAALGNIAFDQGEFDKALGLYLSASELDQELPGLSLFFALVYTRLEMPEIAASYLKKAIEADPNAEQLFQEIVAEDDSPTEEIP